VAQAQSLKGFIEKLFRILRYDVLATSKKKKNINENHI